LQDCFSLLPGSTIWEYIFRLAKIEAFPSLTVKQFRLISLVLESIIFCYGSKIEVKFILEPVHLSEVNV